MLRIATALFAALVLTPLANAQKLSITAPQSSATSTASAPDPALHAVTVAVMLAAYDRGLVKSLPFSATETTTREQTLSDGTVIKNTNVVLVARDSEGRVRAEGELKPDANGTSQGRIVTIFNPTEGKSITWITGNPSLNLSSITHLPESQISGMMNSVGSAPSSAPRTPLRRTLGATLASSSETASIQTESLSEQSVGGVLATGTRTTQVIPAGSVDNDRDFTVVSETWTSAELKTTVRLVSSDPRTGTVTLELSNIDRTEPDASLFTVPANVRVAALPDSAASQAH
jgi:hypothetical protein